jgi:hypothetical protein
MSDIEENILHMSYEVERGLEKISPLSGNKTKLISFGYIFETGI